MRLPLPILGLIIICSCDSSYKRQERIQGNAIVKFDLQGHRGARGLTAENSIAGFRKALSLGVTTLEMDLAVTKDGILVVSHEPWFSHYICLDSLGNRLEQANARDYKIFEMTFDEVSRFDCGSIGNPRFPDQKIASMTKPKLVDVISTCEQSTDQENGFPVNYNIEIKSRIESDNIYHPSPKQFSDLVYKTLDGIVTWDRITIQSFDTRILNYFHNTYPNIKLCYLVGDDPYVLPGLSYRGDKGVEANMFGLEFQPTIYSPQYQLLNKDTIETLHNLNMQVIPWTVNEVSDMERLFNWGVDGLITDYPNRFWETKIDPREVIRFTDN